MSRRQFLALIVPLLLVILGFAAITLLEGTGAVGSPPWDAGFARYVRSTLAYEFVGGIEDERQAWEAYFLALNAYVRHFDNYAEVTAPWEVRRRKEESRGQYVGIGVRSSTGPDGIEIIGVAPGGPAAKVGVKIGDNIVAVDGETIAELSPDGNFDPVAERIKGPKGTKVRISLRNAAGTIRTVVIVRDEVDQGSVFGARFVDVSARIGYVRLDGFVLDTAATFRKKDEEMLKEGMRGLILDLRGNPGGILSSAVEVADAFLDSGVIVRVRGRGEEFNETIRATKEATVSTSLPLVVLIDNESASASEVLAGALRDHRRAVLVGERSWGKFLVQIVEEVSMELGTALFRRTSAIYETPLGYNYQRRSRRFDALAGLNPDIRIAIRRDEQVKLKAIFKHEQFADWDPGSAPVHEDFVDRALAGAIAVLRGETVYPELLNAE